MRARRLKQRLGFDALIGRPASAMEPLDPEGHVLVDGEIWRAIADQALPAGAALRVTGHNACLLEVASAEQGNLDVHHAG
jgi:membrane-bound serine protease (ClpP class)